MKKIISILGFTLISTFSLNSFAKINVLCEKKRDLIEKSICGKSSTEEKRKECISFYRNSDCGTIALHESYDQEL